mmetsp:Transcript_4678/g.12990  ORF Transcript_4678/g.12990 Transcript_4678/m.12990 type:complete len:849 (-) Transcript_4678:1976-4522(-)
MDYFADVQISKQGNLQNRRKQVLTPTSHPVEVQHIPESEGREILEKLNLKSALSKERVKQEAAMCMGAVRQGSVGDMAEVVWKVVRRHLSFLDWMPRVRPNTLKSDIIAGITVGVMVIPQSMSYASIAGLDYVYGMYSAFVPTLVYALLGNSRQLAVGPVAMVSLLIEVGLRGRLTEDECPGWDPNSGRQQYEVCQEQYARLAFLTSLASGLIQFGAGVLNLGFLVSFLGHPVVSGFTSAAAIVIGLSQLKDWLGYPIAKSQFVHVTLYSTFSRITQTNPLNLGLGLIWFGILYAMRWVAGKYPKLKFMRPLGPLVTCVLGIGIMMGFPSLHKKCYDNEPDCDGWNISIVGAIPDGMPPFTLLPWNEMGRVIAPATSAALIGYMESIAIGRSLAAKHEYELPAGQELIALGAANVIGSMFSCYPVTGSFSRSAVNNSTGAQTQLSGLITSLVMLMTLGFLTPLFYYLPKFVLAAIVISSVTSLVAWQDAVHLWHVKKEDCFLWCFAFIATLFLGVEQGILFSVVASLVIIIHESVRPQISILWRLPGTEIYRNVKQENNGVFIKHVLVVRVGASMYFANVAYIREQLLNHILAFARHSEVKYVIMEMTPVISIDSTAIHALEGLLKDLRQKNITLAFATLGNRVEKTMRLAQLYEDIGAEWFHPRVHNAVLHCLKHELQSEGPEEMLLPGALPGLDEEPEAGNANGGDDGDLTTMPRSPRLRHEDTSDRQVYGVWAAPMRQMLNRSREGSRGGSRRPSEQSVSQQAPAPTITVDDNPPIGERRPSGSSLHQRRTSDAHGDGHASPLGSPGAAGGGPAPPSFPIPAVGSASSIGNASLPSRERDLGDRV